MPKTRIEQTEAAMDKLRAEVSEDGISPEEAEYLVSKSITLSNDAGISAPLLEKASDTLLTSRQWGTGSRKLHVARYAAPAIARLTETHESRETDAEGNTVQVFTGFRHDVAQAYFLLHLTHVLSEKTWADYIQTDEYRSANFSTRNMARTTHLREWANNMREHIANRAAESALRRLADPDRMAVAQVKRQRIGALLSAS